VRGGLEMTYYQEILDTVGDAIFTVDLKGNIQTINQAGMDIFGYDNKEIIGKHFSILLGTKEANNLNKLFVDYLAGGVAAVVGKGPVEVVSRSKSGKQFSTELVVCELEKGGEKLFVASMRDITKRKSMEARAKETEEQYRVLAEHANDIIFLADRNGNRLYVSPSVKKHLGYEAASLKGKPPHFLLHPEDRGSEVEEFKRVVFEEKRVHKCRARYQHRNGHFVWFDHLAAPVIDQSGIVKVAVISSRNITSELAGESEKLRPLSINFVAQMIFGLSWK